MRGAVAVFVFGDLLGQRVEQLAKLGEDRDDRAALAQRHQVARSAHRADRQIELLLPIAVPVHEHGKVAVREGGLAVCDRIERDSGIGDNPLAIALRDGAVFLDPLGL